MAEINRNIDSTGSAHKLLVSEGGCRQKFSGGEVLDWVGRKWFGAVFGARRALMTYITHPTDVYDNFITTDSCNISSINELKVI